MDITDIIDKGLVGYYLEADYDAINKELEEQIKDMKEFNEKKEYWLKKTKATIEDIKNHTFKDEKKCTQ